MSQLPTIRICHPGHQDGGHSCQRWARGRTEDEEEMKHFGGSDYYFDRNQNICNISRTTYKGKSCWKCASQLPNVPDHKNADKRWGKSSWNSAGCLCFLSWYLFQDHICSCFYLLLRSSCIWGIINCKINSYSLTWKCNLLVSYRTGCLLMHIYYICNFPLYPIYHLQGPKFITLHVVWAKTLKIMLSSSEKIFKPVIQ